MNHSASVEMYMILDDSTPVLVKYNDFVSYLPVFRTTADAVRVVDDWKSASPSNRYRIEALSLDLYDEWLLKFKSNGTMLFLYPIHPTELKP